MKKKLFLKSTYIMNTQLEQPTFADSYSLPLKFNSYNASYTGMMCNLASNKLEYFRPQVSTTITPLFDYTPVYDISTSTWTDTQYKTIEVTEEKEVLVSPETVWFANSMKLNNNRTQYENYTIYNAVTNEKILEGSIDLGSVPTVYDETEQTKGEYAIVSRGIKYQISNGALVAWTGDAITPQVLIAANVVGIDTTRSVVVNGFNTTLYVTVGSKSAYKKILTDDDLTAQILGNLFEGTGDMLVGLSPDGKKIRITYTLTATGLVNKLQGDGDVKVEMSSDGQKAIISYDLSALKLASMLEGTDSVIVDVAEDGQRVEIHLDQSVVNKLAKALIIPTVGPTEEEKYFLVAIAQGLSQTNLKLGNGLEVQGNTLVCTVQGAVGQGATIVTYSTSISTEQFDALMADVHSCIYYIDGSDTTGHSLTFRRVSNHTQSSNNYIEFWTYDGLGKLQLLTLTKSASGEVTVDRTTHKLAPLDSDGKIPSLYLPSYVDDVLEYASMSAFPATGEGGKIYVAKDTNKTYRWSGTQYSEISSSLALGETAQTAYAGDKGAKNAADIATNKTNIATNKSDIAALTTRVQTLESGGTGTSAEAISVDTVNTIAQEIYGV